MENQLPEPAAAKTLDQCILLAARAVGGAIQADSVNSQRHYNYISSDRIVEVCGKALFEQDILLVPAIVKTELDSMEFVDASGSIRKMFTASVDFEFHLRAPESNLVMAWHGAGVDYQAPDKAFYKAITSGHKYFLMKLLMISVGNEDGEHEEPKTSPARADALSPGDGPEEFAGMGQPRAKAPAAVPTNTTQSPNYSKLYWSHVLDQLGWSKPQASQYLREHQESVKAALKDLGVIS